MWKSSVVKGGDLHVVGLVVTGLVDWHSALAVAAPEEVCRDHAHRCRGRDAVVDCGQQERLGAAARATGNPNPFGVHSRQAEQEVETANAAPELQGKKEPKPLYNRRTTRILLNRLAFG